MTDEFLPSLSSFVQRNASNSELYDTKRIAATVKHTLEPQFFLYSNLVEHVRKNPNDSKAFDALQEIAGEIRRTAREALNTLKSATEIDVLQSTKFDSLQVLSLIQQLPVLILDEVTELATTLLQEEVPPEGLARQIFIQKHVDAFAVKLRERIDSISVPATVTGEEVAESVNAVEEELIAMKLSVPALSGQERPSIEETKREDKESA